MATSDFDLAPLHTQDPLGRFSGRALDYAAYRPSYPAEAIATALEGLGDPKTVTIADIGAGTGIASRLFAATGAKVIAIEPNDAMRSLAAPYPRVEFREGRAEATGLPDHSVDLITCCQAFHWFQPDPTLTEFHRCLKPTGRLALMWNERDSDDEFTQQYRQVVRNASDRALFDRRDRHSPEALAHSSRFQHFRQITFEHAYWLDLDGLIGLALSSSYVIKEAHVLEAMEAEMRSLHERWQQATAAEDAKVPLRYYTHLYLAEPVHYE